MDDKQIAGSGVIKFQSAAGRLPLAGLYASYTTIRPISRIAGAKLWLSWSERASFRRAKRCRAESWLQH